MTVQESNKLIAEFIGLPSPPVYNLGYDETGYGYYDANELEYHTSWDWLMPVVEKIESLGAISVIIADYYCIVTADDGTAYFKETNIRARTKIAMVYEAVVEFITWWNIQTYESKTNQ